MSSQKILWIINEVINTEQLCIRHFLKSFVSNVPLLIEWQVLPGEEDGVFEKCVPLIYLLGIVVEEDSLKSLNNFIVVGS